MLNEFGTLHESNGRYALKFERFFPHPQEQVFCVITNPSSFSQWYPFATGEMDLKLGGKIAFNDGEGTTYEATVTELEKPYLFGFREVDDLINISLHEEEKGCRMIFTHTFIDGAWAVNTAAGWHRCLDVLYQIVNGHQIEWEDNSAELRDYYREIFN
ncbi:SRPBCC family protein [Sutcliffiella horikoshii]|uniref:SRPBCC family protein n=1 Tax=Sutcliffiella horikoshii TaxID=79883 RepID=UPI001F237FCE|nr:SRPBCC family protein [Sutcliffiella horikoshii]MCG1020975.1 SRPBCC family protein [Sutcliffiella horikoshii]